jgi:stage II sporulation protein M
MKKTKKRRDKKEKICSLKENLILSCNYLKESRKFIYAIVIIFFAFAIMGFALPTPDAIVQKILEIIQDILAQTEGLSYSGMFSFIFLNNFKVSLIGMVTGIILGIFPILTAIGNGYLLGFVAKYSAQQNGAWSLLKILPHGIFELPAVFISLGLGLRLGMLFFKRKNRNLRKNFSDSLKAFFFIVVPLLLIAAIIETSLIFLFAK